MSRLLAIASIAAAVVLGACGDGDSGEDGGTADAPAQDAGPYGGGVQRGDAEGKEQAAEEQKQAQPGTKITISGSQFGEILFDADNQAIYLFDKETDATPQCYGECADAWPPVLTEGDPVAAGAADQTLLGTTKRDDGTTQVTYAGQPLYYYAHEGPGQVLCHNVSEFGGLWLVLDAKGDALS
jgi:predicted lipoprotein with Yx(FWY)xxD motif